MKHALALFALLGLLSSCTTYQHVTLISDLPAEPQSGRFYAEDGDVTISYDFEGHNLPVTSIIQNSGDSILYVDLAASVYTVNGQVVSNAFGSKVVRFQSLTSSYEYQSFDFIDSRTEGQAIVPPDKSIIAIPAGMYARVVNRPFGVGFDQFKADRSRMDQIQLSSGATRSFRRYNPGDEGQLFGVYFRVGNRRDLSDGKLIGARFKEIDIVTTIDRVVDLPSPESQRYHVSKRSGGGAFLLLLTGAIIVVLAADASDGEPGN